MDSQQNIFSTREVIHQSVNAQTKLATEPILSQVEKLCSLLAERSELETAGNSEATDWGRQDTSASTADNW